MAVALNSMYISWKNQLLLKMQYFQIGSTLANILILLTMLCRLPMRWILVLSYHSTEHTFISHLSFWLKFEAFFQSRELPPNQMVHGLEKESVKMEKNSLGWRKATRRVESILEFKYGLQLHNNNLPVMLSHSIIYNQNISESFKIL